MPKWGPFNVSYMTQHPSGGATWAREERVFDTMDQALTWLIGTPKVVHVVIEEKELEDEEEDDFGAVS